LGNRAQGLVVEDDVSRHLPFARGLGAPGAQCLEQGGIGWRQARGGIAAAGLVGRAAPAALARRSGRELAQAALALAAQDRPGGPREAQGAVGAEVDGDELERDALADHRAPFAIVEFRADAEDAQAIMAEARDSLVLLAEQHIEHVLGAEALAGAIDARE